MSSVPKLGNNRYLATSKGVNRMLNQLNGILAADNMTVQTVATGSGNAVTVNLAAGNFVNLTLSTGTATAITFTNYMPGTYFLKIITGSATNTVSFSGSIVKVTGTTYTPTQSSGAIDFITLVCDGTNLFTSSIEKTLV